MLVQAVHVVQTVHMVQAVQLCACWCRLCVSGAALRCIAALCDGDARCALNTLQLTLDAKLAQARRPTTQGQGCEVTGAHGGASSGQRGAGRGDGEAYRGQGEVTNKGRPWVVTEQDVKDAQGRAHLNYDRAGELARLVTCALRVGWLLSQMANAA